MTEKQNIAINALKRFFELYPKSKKVEMATLNKTMNTNVAAATLTSLVKAGEIERERIGNCYRYYFPDMEDTRTEEEKKYDSYEEAAERLYGLYSHINNSYACWYRQFEECGVEFPTDAYNAWYNAVCEAVEKKQRELEIECVKTTGKPIGTEMVYFDDENN